MTDSLDNRGLGIVRVKPLGVGGGGVERGVLKNGSSSSSSAVIKRAVADRIDNAFSASSSLGIKFTDNSVTLLGGRPKTFTFPKMVVPPEHDNEALFNEFMPHMIDGFLSGCNVNICAYGQTGTGKTHTMFGPPGILADSVATGRSTEVRKGYGLFPRALIAIFEKVHQQRQANAGKNYVLCGAAVEMAFDGNIDMFVKNEGKTSDSLGFWGNQMSNGVGVDKSVKPAMMYGQSEHVMKSGNDILKMFAALSVRNTAGTSMNESSSRSHCFAWLTLHEHDKASDTVRKMRFQFCDLAGSERMVEAHGDSNYKVGGLEAFNGLMTNWSLMCLGQCVRDLNEMRKKNQKITNHSLRKYLGDLVPLLSQSLTGEAITALFVCVSQNEANNAQSFHALEFGSQFADLQIRRQHVKWVNRRGIIKMHEKRFENNKKLLGDKPRTDKYSIQRIAQNNESQFVLNVTVPSRAGVETTASPCSAQATPGPSRGTVKKTPKAPTSTTVWTSYLLVEFGLRRYLGFFVNFAAKEAKREDNCRWQRLVRGAGCVTRLTNWILDEGQYPQWKDFTSVRSSGKR